MKKLFALLVFLLFLTAGCLEQKKQEIIVDKKQDEVKNYVTGSSLTIGVWMQSPTRERNGVQNVVTYKNMGINTFIGLWQWPTENWAYKGYTIKTATALKENGMKVYAGKDQAAVDWNKAHPEFADTFVGYMLGDEADMFKVNYYSSTDSAIQAKWAWALPNNWKTTCEAIKVQDPARAFYANFGKPFAGGFYRPDPGSTKEADFAKYVSPTTVYSCDFYGMTDPYEKKENHGVWKYGAAVKHSKQFADGRPVWGFVEVSAPWSKSNPDVQMSERMKAEWVKPIVWNMIINGAKGIVYFCHNFLPNESKEDGCLEEAGMAEAMTNANSSIQKYADVILSPDVAGTTVTTTGAVEVLTMTKKFGGATYVFAMGNGNASNILGAQVTATITIADKTLKNISVENENRDLTITNGAFTDTFAPYEVHIYKIN